ncbi:MAG: hypothetical protein QF704_13380 [Anaerolineales bacterium]|nr:hypothetical protein [Anaerolineales bacterium]
MGIFVLLVIYNVPNVQSNQMKLNVQGVTLGISLIVLQHVLLLAQGFNMGMTVLQVIQFVLVVILHAQVAQELRLLNVEDV